MVESISRKMQKSICINMKGRRRNEEELIRSFGIKENSEKIIVEQKSI